MNIALFGGTFDPIHRGHLAVARAALRRFRLHEVHFIPAHLPPHKQRRPLSDFAHRYAMLALATAAEPRFIPSLLEAPGVVAGRPSYSLETVQRARRHFRRGDRLFFLIGIDAFLDVAAWYRPQQLLQACDFIVVSRPGYTLQSALSALPADLRSRARRRGSTLRLGNTAVYLLEGVRQSVSATAVRSAAARGRPLARLVPSQVAGYIRKTHLYQAGA